MPGADVAVNYVRGEDQAREVVAEIEKSGSFAFAHQADISQEYQVSAMFEKMKAKLGRQHSCRLFGICRGINFLKSRTVRI